MLSISSLGKEGEYEDCKKDYGVSWACIERHLVFECFELTLGVDVMVGLFVLVELYVQAAAVIMQVSRIVYLLRCMCFAPL